MSAPNVGDFEIEVFFDGGCPLCRREIAMLRRKDRRERIRFTDIGDPGFDPAAIGKTHEELMARIHGKLPDGRLIEGVEVFRRLYAAIGFGWLVALARLPLVSQLLDLGYALFARYRVRLAGRCSDAICVPPARPTNSRVSPANSR